MPRSESVTGCSGTGVSETGASETGASETGVSDTGASDTASSARAAPATSGTGGCTGCHFGTTTPSETTIFSASSIVISSSTTSSRGTNRMKPDVGFGVVGTKTVSTTSPVFSWTSPTGSDVWNPSEYTPLRGYWIISAFLNESLVSLNTTSTKCF